MSSITPLAKQERKYLVESHRPLVSIITPFLNAGSFLQEAVESVLDQTYTNWELALIDDGSTDESTDVAKRYAEQSPGKIRYLEHFGHRNLGASSSRNLGREHSSGEYIAYLDADDVWLPDRLEQQLSIFEMIAEAGMVVGSTVYWHRWTGRAEDKDKDEFVLVGAPQNSLARPPALLSALYPLGEGASPSMNSVLVRSDVVDRIGGWNDEFKRVFTDQVFLAKVYTSTPVYVSSACCDYYRQRSTSSSQIVRQEGEFHKYRHQFLVWLEGHMISVGMEQSNEWRKLQRALWRYRHPVMSRVARTLTRAYSSLTSSSAP
ncbi:glycosyltransferase family 2 protein [Mesorhizobium sp.]|uniref:glycosyltransferase family 2 protein n=1 Tax=Mesorhizobium sp. TaxID=1871066 RepID=UPI000FE6ED9A|nr:glycosyltransferase family 2 protein [Mesorhizobium sp.]RWO52669.1 MAG: glycosyltransferase family 2 protein [Mesorhizobium sp.]TIN28419.1 MAG: glycosyltransferase family 2 protein [Mesorhizobium sp.]TIN36026.1 MAG: glycosyltransferase family 2 protein [Mesorhizobium sp.]TJU84840.1 MAG: glycosyltransferase family 2 protein [Mesorhizobium sp.]TJU85472.1 MAG: glycosyltransferase family 2 protein [Mesorhizobium sp.]